MNILLVSVIYNNNKISINWSAESDVVHYEICILSANGKEILTHNTDSNTLSLDLKIEDYPFKVGGVYFVVVRYSANNVVSNWSTPVEFIINNLALPINIVSCEAGTIKAKVSNPNVDVAVYAFQLLEKNDPIQDDNTIFAKSVVTTKGLPSALSSQVEIGKSYQVRSQLWLQNAISDWTDYSEITIIDVSKPNLSVNYKDKIIHCSWEEISEANGYELECWTTGSVPEQIFKKTITKAPYEVEISEGFEEDQVYDMRLRAYQESCYSEWDEKEVYTSSLSPVLKELYGRLLTAYTASGNKSLTLDKDTLGDDGTDIIALFNKELKTDNILLNNPITITPYPKNDQVLLSGFCMDSLLGIEASPLQITFSTEVTKTKILICLSIPTGNDWTFTKTFPELSSTYIDSFTFDTSKEQFPAFVLCSIDQPEDSLIAGLNFQGSINVAGALSNLSDLISDVGATVPITGKIIREGTLLTIELKGQVPDVTLDFSGIQQLSFLNPAFVFYVKQDISQSYISLARWIESDVTLSKVGIPLAIRLPDAVSGWSVMLTPGKTMPLGNIPNFLGFIVGLDLSLLLPSAIETLNCFNLTGFQLAFDKDQTTFNSLSLAFDTAPSPTPLWTILPCLSFNQLSLQLQVYPKDKSSLTYRADILGVFSLTDTLALQARIILPIGSDNWVFSCYSTEPIDSLAAISSLMNGADLSEYLPQELGAIGQFELSGLTITYNAKVNTLTSLGININSAAPWVLIKDRLIIQRICINLTMTNPFDASRYMTGMIQGCLSIGQGDIEATVLKQTATSPWLFTTELLPGTMISISDLALVAGTKEEDIDSFLPTSLPLVNLLALTQFYLEYDISNIILNNTSFTISLNQPWVAIENYVSLETAEVSMEIINNPQTSIGFMAYISARILLEKNGAGIVFDAGKKTEDASWDFSGIMIGSLKVNFNDLLNTINLSENFVIPNESWLPTIEFTELSANMTPENALFHVNGMANIDWTIPFVDIEFPMKSLGGTVDIKHEAQEGEKPEDKSKANWFKAIVIGNFQFASISTTLTLQLGSKDVENVFTAELTKSEVSEVDIPTLTNSFSDGNEDSQWDQITPNDITALNFNAAYLYYNQTTSDYFAYGSINNFGDVIFYSKNTGTEDKPVKGYIFAFALADGFKFSNLFSALAPIDNILNIENAGIAITSYEVASATELVTEINQIVTIQDKFGSITNPIQQGNLPAGVVNKGVHLYSRLNFTGSLFAVFNQLVSTGTDGLNVTLYAFFSTESEPEKGSVKTIFQATFDAFDLINGLISFKGIDNAPGITMKYIQTDSSEFSLDGIIGFNVFGGNYDFIGRLTVNDDQTHFNVNTPPETSITIQLFPDSMPPLMVLKQLGLDVIYYFQTAERTQKYLELNVTGKVELVETIFLSSNLYLLDAKPILAQITLEQDFSISQLIGNIVGNDQPWPTDFFDITFIANTPQQPSRVYYYVSSVDTTPSKVNTDGNNYQNGYNLESTIDLTFLFTIRIILEVNIETNVGMEASVGLGEAIKIFILELASKDKASDGNKKYINGPTLNLNTKGKTSVFGFATGFNFFQYPFGTADVTIGKKELGSGKTETKIGAKLTADKAVPIFGNLSVDFTYCQSEGFVINDWPDFSQVYESVQKIIDIADEVSDIMKKTDPSLICGAIVDLVADTVYENRFTMSPSFSTEGNENDGYSLYFVLNGTFEVYVLNQQVANVDFPNTIQIPLPDSTSFDDLGGYIEDAIKGSAESFVKGLMNNSEQWANLVAILFTEQAAELAAQMLCEGLIDTVVAEAITVGAEAVLAAGGIAAGAVAITAGIAAVGKAISSCFTAGTEVIMADGSKKIIENVIIGDELKGYNNAVNKVLGYDRPKLGYRKLYAINEGPFFFTSEHPLLTTDGWKAIDPAKTRLETSLLEVDKLTIGDTLIINDGTTLKIDEIQEARADSDTQLYNFNLSGNNTYVANGFIVHNKGENPPKDQKPNPPEIKSLEYNIEKQEITTKWAKAEYANGYNYQLVKPDGSKLEQKSLCYSENSVTTSIRDEDLPSGELEAKVCSTRGDYSSKWSEKSIQKLASTKDIVLSYDESNELLQVNWDSITAPAGYLISLFNGFDEIIQNKTDKNVYSIDCNTLPEGIISAKVGAAGNSNNIPGDLASSTNTIEKPTSPANVIISIDNEKIKVTWDNATNTNGFEIVLLKDSQTLNTTQTTDNQIEFDTSTLEAGVYTAKVRKQGSTTELPSNYATAQGSILKLGAPTNINFAYNTSTESLDINWENVDQNDGYNLQIVNANDKIQIAWEGSIATDEVTKSIPVSALSSNYSDYVVCIKALGGDNVLDSQYSTSANEVIQIKAPTSTSISYDMQMQIIKCTWSNVDDAASYQIQIENKQLESAQIVYQSNESKDITEKEVSISEITDFPAGTYCLLVQALGNPDIIPSKFTESDDDVIKLSEVIPNAVFENNVIEVSWDLEENASSYQIKLSNADKSKTYEYLTTNTPYEINASAYTEGEFTLTLQAQSDKNNVIDSDTGTGISLTVNPLDINSLAKHLKESGADVEQTSKKIHQAFPDVNYIDFTVALADSGYTEQEAVVGLKQEFPDLTPEEFVEAINAAFKQQTPGELAKQAKSEGKSACDAGTELMANYPQLIATDFAVALAKGGYSQTDVVGALKQEFPNLTPSEFVHVINTAFN